MLKVECQEHLDEVRRFADEQDCGTGLRRNLEEQISYLDNYAGKENSRCILRKDFAPLSFSFIMERKRESDYLYWFNGGLIFHGAGDSGAGAPTFSVRLGDLNAGWAIHT